MQIPKILHQTWKDEILPAGLKRLANTWKEKHPDWAYYLWTDAQNRKFIEEYYPSFIEKYDGYSSHIQRVDAVRYLLLYKYGGLFIDLDFECCKNIESLLEHATCVFGKEPHAHCKIHNKNMIISNAIMGAVPGHPFLEAVYQELNTFSDQTTHKNNKVLESTGPFMLTRVYTGYTNKQDVTLLDHNLIYPLTKNGIASLFKNRGNTQKLKKKIQQAFAVHYYSGTWWDAQSHVNISLLEESII